MATVATEQMQTGQNIMDITKCRMCQNDCEDPRLLQCLHTFCAKCIKSHCGDTQRGRRRVKCPACGEDCLLPALGGLGGLQPNAFVAKLIRRAAAAGAMMMCEGCGVKSCNKATVRCADCRKNFCDDCSKQCRLRRKRNAGPHSVKKLNEDDADGVNFTAADAEDSCEHHPDHILEKYCNECSVCFCSACEEEGKHFGHNIANIEEAAEEFSSSLDADVVELSILADKLRKVKAQLAEARSSIGANVEQQLTQRAEEIKQLVETEMDKLIGEISVAKAPAEEEIKSRVEKASRSELAFDSFMYFAKAVKEKGTPCDIARLAADIDNRADQLKKLEVGDGEFPLPEIKFEPAVLEDAMEKIGGVRNLFGCLVISGAGNEVDDISDSEPKGASKPRPQEEFTFNTPDNIVGIVHCDNKLYAIRSQTSSVYVWAADTGDQLPDIEVKMLREPASIAVCTESKNLYIADNSMSSQCVWRVSSDGSQVQKWLPNRKSKTPFVSRVVSVTSRRLLVYTNADLIFLFGSDGEELRRIFPPAGIKQLYGATESSRDTIIIGYWMLRPQISEMDFDEKLLRHYGGELGLAHFNMSPGNDGRIYVNDARNLRILQLNGSLEMEKVILDLNNYFDPSKLQPLIGTYYYVTQDQRTRIAVTCRRENHVRVFLV